VQPEDLAKAIRLRRMRAGMTLRQLSRSAGIATASLSAIERGESSPTLALLHKIVNALGTDFAEFFAASSVPGDEWVFPAEGMRSVQDKSRKYLFVLPKRKDIKFEMILETLLAGEGEWETHDCDIGGIVLAGGPLKLEIEGNGVSMLRTGTAFYVPKGLKHRGSNLGKRTIRLLSVYSPPRY
jgi:transcriptional regulator with XRE-family HTH domain